MCCVIDQCQPVSRIAAATSKEYQIGTLTYAGEKGCRVEFGKGLAINFVGIDQADRRFYRFQHVDFIFGADMYAKLLIEGVLKKPELPLAQMAVFGRVLSGAYPT